jgi:UDP-glucuronate 4-epimerase
MTEFFSPSLITGAAGFIGFHLANALLHKGLRVVGVDRFSESYDVSLKHARWQKLCAHPNFVPLEADLAQPLVATTLLKEWRPQAVVHLAAQAGVRQALLDPTPYVQDNLVATANLFEALRHYPVAHTIYASSSSVYGGAEGKPCVETDRIDHPVSFYAATKVANEALAYSYAHLYGLPLTGLRFFTVYGPWGRPDMAVYRFTDAIARGEPLQVVENGTIARDFTYIDDIVEGIVRLLAHPPQSTPPHAVYNIGNSTPETLNTLIDILEEQLGRKATRMSVPLPQGDVLQTWANHDKLTSAVGFTPRTPLREGLAQFVRWYTR